MSRKRNKNYNTVHHLTSRIAHRVFFLKKEERNDFMDLVRRVSAFSGVELIGWCVLDNHFHLYVYLPVPPPLTDEQVRQRMALLKGDCKRLLADEAKDEGDCVGGVNSMSEENPMDRIRRRMYSIAEYMKMIKQWFTEGYNERNGHKGTMWEAVYGDRATNCPEDDFTDMRNTLAYVHLNPIRAAVAAGFDEYPWSSYASFRNGDELAQKGMRLAYPGMSDEEIVVIHESRMAALLEEEKRKRAAEIARKRSAGYEIPCDPLTSEAMVAQEMEKIRQIQNVVMEMQAEREIAKGAENRRELIRRQILCELAANPGATSQSLSQILDVPLRSVQRYLAQLSKSGELARKV